MEYLKALPGIAITFLVSYFIARQLWRTRAEQKQILFRLAQRAEQTGDLRVSAMTYKKVLVDVVGQFAYCKFAFTEDEAFVFPDNSFSRGNYRGAYVLKQISDSHYGYFSCLCLFKFEVNVQDVKINFGRRVLLGSSFKVSLDQVLEVDLQLLNKYLG